MDIDDASQPATGQSHNIQLSDARDFQNAGRNRTTVVAKAPHHSMVAHFDDIVAIDRQLQCHFLGRCLPNLPNLLFRSRV
ncbi:MAG: hypothetical protein ABF479_11175 [Gluconacetobacter sp.]